ncbi:hypothetical protein ACWCXB_35200 [Streptomyces sp. NPDC001514]
MGYKIARRAAVVVASAAVAAAGLLATRGSASAATLTTGDRTAAVSHAVRSAVTHNGDEYSVRDDDIRRRWVLDQVDWARNHGDSSPA